MEIKGKFNTAIVFTDNIEYSAIQQIQHLMSQEFTTGSKVRIMPDVHAGMGCTVGTTMTIADKVVPNLVGVDIGCGMVTVVMRNKRVELSQLDKAVHKNIPAGFAVREKSHRYADTLELRKLKCSKHVDLNRSMLSIGTLGGGNHFIELDKDDDGRLYLVVHTGSRNLGKQVCEWYQTAAAQNMQKQGKGFDRVLAYVDGELFNDYLHDMAIVQEYANLNRQAIVNEIVKNTDLEPDESFSTIHNYIDMKNMILRKGAISAHSGEQVLIPLNMRDGSLLCIGKGNPDWNYSAPHGAGRLLSRSAAKESVTLTQFKEAMSGIYSTTVGKSTIDESPFAYKPTEDIVNSIGETVEITKRIKPVYNFKAGSDK